ncbi:hypothetical protein WJX72_007218 [[Myrmecia] bisecta]|uniref:Uncharacterized protein n=1 Tax=[Myrmecia] bisecta TaxID=41462 RepID=A0AAW1QFG4_9CHLO
MTLETPERKACLAGNTERPAAEAGHSCSNLGRTPGFSRADDAAGSKKRLFDSVEETLAGGSSAARLADATAGQIQSRCRRLFGQPPNNQDEQLNKLFDTAQQRARKRFADRWAWDVKSDSPVQSSESGWIWDTSAPAGQVPKGESE